jgi:hypothetical protein
MLRIKDEALLVKHEPPEHKWHISYTKLPLVHHGNDKHVMADAPHNAAHVSLPTVK